MLDPITAICLNDLPGIRHGFFTRVGGGSQGVLASANSKSWLGRFFDSKWLPF